MDIEGLISFIVIIVIFVFNAIQAAKKAQQNKVEGSGESFDEEWDWEESIKRQLEEYTGTAKKQAPKETEFQEEQKPAKTKPITAPESVREMPRQNKRFSGEDKAVKAKELAANAQKKAISKRKNFEPTYETKIPKNAEPESLAGQVVAMAPKQMKSGLSGGAKYKTLSELMDERKLAAALNKPEEKQKKENTDFKFNLRDAIIYDVIMRRKY